jgi:hypothetical protein
MNASAIHNSMKRISKWILKVIEHSLYINFHELKFSSFHLMTLFIVHFISIIGYV